MKNLSKLKDSLKKYIDDFNFFHCTDVEITRYLINTCHFALYHILLDICYKVRLYCRSFHGMHQVIYTTINIFNTAM